MKKILLAFSGSMLIYISAYTQETENQSIGQAIDDLTFKWDTEAESLNSYEGLSRFCLNEEYRSSVIELLSSIHHYDSVLYDRLVKVQRHHHDKEIEKTLEDIKEFEGEYSMKKFIHFLHEECQARKQLEKDADETKNDLGANSYDGQVYVLETELNKYIKHITKRMDNIRKHVHHLNIK